MEKLYIYFMTDASYYEKRRIPVFVKWRKVQDNFLPMFQEFDTNNFNVVSSYLEGQPTKAQFLLASESKIY